MLQQCSQLSIPRMQTNPVTVVSLGRREWVKRWPYDSMQARFVISLSFPIKWVGIMKNMSSEWFVVHFLYWHPAIEMRDRWTVKENTMMVLILNLFFLFPRTGFMS